MIPLYEKIAFEYYKTQNLQYIKKKYEKGIMEIYQIFICWSREQLGRKYRKYYDIITLRQMIFELRNNGKSPCQIPEDKQN